MWVKKQNTYHNLNKGAYVLVMENIPWNSIERFWLSVSKDFTEFQIGKWQCNHSATPGTPNVAPDTARLWSGHEGLGQANGLGSTCNTLPQRPYNRANTRFFSFWMWKVGCRTVLFIPGQTLWWFHVGDCKLQSRTGAESGRPEAWRRGVGSLKVINTQRST